MTAPIIQARYDELDQIALRFGRSAEVQRTLIRTVQQQADVLTGGSWQGRGVTAFARELDNTVMPAMARLGEALLEAQRVTLQIAVIVGTAEESAAQPFRQDGKELTLAATSTQAIGPPPGPDSSGPFHLGEPTPPNIEHDNGFLDRFPRREPTAADYARLVYWRTKLEGAEALRPDLADATAAYRHFLDGNGTDRTIDYNRFLTDDPHGETVLRNLISDTQRHAETIGEGRSSFNVTSEPYTVGGNDVRFPYPESENWQKALGGHNVWVSANVQVSGEPPNRVFTMHTVIHMEDRYNFNPGASDIATGIPDEANGIFELTGIAHQYMNYGEARRTVVWREGDFSGVQIENPDSGRSRRPADNRRIRNRL